jgi:hypothetical protein
MDRYGLKSATMQDEWSGGFRLQKRAKRHVAQAANYNIKSSMGRMTPLGSIAKLLMESVLAKKNKTQAPRWVS